MGLGEKRKIVLACDMHGNNGPSNVCKKIKQYSNRILFWDSKNRKIKNLIRGVYHVLRADVFIIGTSGRINYIYFRLARFLRKKTIYIMHGYIGYESDINNSNKSKKEKYRETKLLNMVNLIIPVSQKYRDFFLSKRSEYSTKTHYLTNGIELTNNALNTAKDEGKIVVCGANRTIKRNSKVCEAVNMLNKQGYDYHLDIYGYMYDNNELLVENENITIHGRISREKLIKEMSEASLFVLNSQIDSFGLSAVDALSAGCDILISENAGITSIMDLDEMDIIHDCNDTDEIANKIKYNVTHSNCKRIIQSIDFDHYSWENVTKRLEEIAARVYENKEVKDIV